MKKRFGKTNAKQRGVYLKKELRKQKFSQLLTI